MSRDRSTPSLTFCVHSPGVPTFLSGCGSDKEHEHTTVVLLIGVDLVTLANHSINEVHLVRHVIHLLGLTDYVLNPVVTKKSLGALKHSILSAEREKLMNTKEKSNFVALSVDLEQEYILVNKVVKRHKANWDVS